MTLNLLNNEQTTLTKNYNFFKFQYFSNIIIENYINKENKNYNHQKNEHPMSKFQYTKNNIKLGIIKQ